MNRIIKISIGFVIILLGCASVSFAKRDIPDNNLSYPILITLDNKSSATGFFLHHDSTFVFVTARHVLFNEAKMTLKSKNATLLFYSIKDSTSGQFLVKLKLDSLQLSKKVRYHKSHDIAIVQIAKRWVDSSGTPKLRFSKYAKFVRKAKLPIISVDFAECKKFKDVFIANEVIVFGYPSSLGIKKLAQIDYDRPLLRKGIVAGVNTKKKTIILDCPVYKGNSGGPVLEIDRTNLVTTSFRIIGVVSQFVPFAETWVNISQGYSNVEFTNSGYSVVTPIEFVFEIL